MIPIYIPTRGIVSITYDNFPDDIKKSVILFTDKILDHIPLEQQILFDGNGIANKRQACVEHAIMNRYDYMVMVDDDVIIRRIINDNGKLKLSKGPADSNSYQLFFEDAIHKFESDKNLAIISDHQKAFMHIKRDSSGIDKFVMHNLNTIKTSGCIYNRIEIFEDIDFYLQLFNSGRSSTRTKILSSSNNSKDYVAVSHQRYIDVFKDWESRFPCNISIAWETPSIFAGNKNIPVKINIKWRPMK